MDEIIGSGLVDLIQSHLDREHPDPGSEKVLRSVQLLLKHHMQNMRQLSEGRRNLEGQNRHLEEKCNRIQNRLDESEKQLLILKAECKRRRRIIRRQQECLLSGKDPTQFKKCDECSKTFINQTFLESHRKRKHPEAANINRTAFIPDPDTKKDAAVNTAENVGQDVEEALVALTKEIRSAAAIMDSLSHPQKVEGSNMRDVELVGSMEELKMLVRKQDLNLEVIQILLNKTKPSTESIVPTVPEEAKLLSQERFWQAKMKSIRNEYDRQIEEIQSQLQLAVSLKPNATDCESVAVQTDQLEQELSNEYESLSETRIPREFGNMVTISREDISHHQAIDDEQSETRSNQSEEDLSDHEYASIENLLVEMERSQETLNRMKDEASTTEPPAFLYQYRIQAADHLDSVLYKDFGIRPDEQHLADEQQLEWALKLARDKRKKRDDSRVLHNYRKMCASELADLIFLANGRHGEDDDDEAKSLLGKRLSGVRRSLMRIWNRNRPTRAAPSSLLGRDFQDQGTKFPQRLKHEDEKQRSQPDKEKAWPRSEPNEYMDRKGDQPAVQQPADPAKRVMPVPAPRTKVFCSGFSRLSSDEDFSEEHRDLQAVNPRLAGHNPDQWDTDDQDVDDETEAESESTNDPPEQISNAEADPDVSGTRMADPEVCILHDLESVS